MIAAPTPCTARIEFSSAMWPARAQQRELVAKVPRPIRKSRRRPSRSASAPAVSTVAASASVYASTTHCRPERPVRRSAAMSDSAVLTTAMSSMSIAVAAQTTASVQRWLRIGKLLG
jgi:hypothetical protein